MPPAQREWIDTGGNVRGMIRLDLIFHAIASSLDEDGFGMVQESIENGGGEGGVVIEDLGPILKARLEVMMMEPRS